MQAPNFNNSSYYLSAHSNERFEKYIDKKLVDVRKPGTEVMWWSKTAPYDLHCSLGSFSLNGSATAALNQSVKSKAVKVLDKVEHSLLMKVEGFDITESGWVILKFTPKNKLKEFHKDLVKEMESLGLEPSEFSGKKYMAHVSIGRLKVGGDKQKALQEVKKIFNKIVAKPFPFVMYDLELVHSQNKKNDPIISKEFPRQNIGIITTTPNKKGKPFRAVKLSNAKNASKLAKKLHKYYGIDSAVKPGSPKTVKQVHDKHGPAYTLRLYNNEFKKVEGHFNNLA